jgi:hypothetical protein
MLKSFDEAKAGGVYVGGAGKPASAVSQGVWEGECARDNNVLDDTKW